jgi:hypothetical protein
MGIAVTATNTLQCQPVSAFWSIADRFEKCWDTTKVTNIGMVIGCTPGSVLLFMW